MLYMLLVLCLIGAVLHLISPFRKQKNLLAFYEGEHAKLTLQVIVLLCIVFTIVVSFWIMAAVKTVVAVVGAFLLLVVQVWSYNNEAKKLNALEDEATQFFISKTWYDNVGDIFISIFLFYISYKIFTLLPLSGLM